MEAKYLKFLRENHKDLYDECVKAEKHMVDWRDKEIERLKGLKT